MDHSTAAIDRKLHVVHIVLASDPRVRRHVADLAREQKARGHQVGLLVEAADGDTSAGWSDLEPDLALGLHWLPKRFPAALQSICAAVAIARCLKRLEADVVHSHGPGQGAFALLPALVNRRRPVRVHAPSVDNLPGGSLSLARPFAAIFERVAAYSADVIVFDSLFLAHRHHQCFGDTPAMVRIVANGIGRDAFVPVRPNSDAADFVCMGELRNAGGFDLAIDALAFLTRKTGRRFTLTLVGSGPDRDGLEERAKLRGIADQLSFRGALPDRQAFALGNILLLPTRAQSELSVLLTAAAAQVPVIATDVGNAGEIFGPYRHHLIPAGNALALAQAMEKTIDLDASRLRQHAADLAAYVDARFSLAVTGEGIDAAYRDALARDKASAQREPKFNVRSSQPS